MQLTQLRDKCFQVKLSKVDIERSIFEIFSMRNLAKRVFCVHVYIISTIFWTFFHTLSNFFSLKIEQHEN